MMRLPITQVAELYDTSFSPQDFGNIIAKLMASGYHIEEMEQHMFDTMYRLLQNNCFKHHESRYLYVKRVLVDGCDMFITEGFTRKHAAVVTVMRVTI